LTYQLPFDPALDWNRTCTRHWIEGPEWKRKYSRLQVRLGPDRHRRPSRKGITKMIVKSKNKSQPVFVYAALAIVVLSLSLIFVCSNSRETIDPPSALFHQQQ
jgi:hypothetical protein